MSVYVANAKSFWGNEDMGSLPFVYNCGGKEGVFNLSLFYFIERNGPTITMFRHDGDFRLDFGEEEDAKKIYEGMLATLEKHGRARWCVVL